MNHRDHSDDHMKIVSAFHRVSDHATTTIEYALSTLQDDAYELGFQRGAQINRQWIERAKRLIEHAEQAGAFSHIGGTVDIGIRIEPLTDAVDQLMSDYEDLSPCEPEAKKHPALMSAA